MALNSLGLGFLFTAQNLASATFKGVQRDLITTAKTSEIASARIGKAMNSIKAGALLAGAGAAGLLVLGVAVGEASRFSTAIAEVSTLVDEAAFSTDKLRDITLEMTNVFGGDPVAQAKALYQTISAGASDAESATLLMDAANRLAIGGVTEVETAVDVLTSAVNVYSASGLSAAQASDSLFVAIKAGKTTAGELGAALGRVLPTANALNISFDEVNASIAAMTANGLATSRAVTGLNAALANIKKPTKDATAEAARLGIKFNEASLRSKGLQGFLDEVTSSAKFNKESFTKLFASVEAGNAIISLTSNGMAKFNETLDLMGQKTGATNTAFEKMSATLGFQQNRFEGLKKVALITIGQAIEPAVASLVGFVNDLLEAFNNLDPGVKSFLTRAFAIASIVAVVTGVILLLKGAFILLGVTMAGFTAFLGSAILAAAPLVFAIGGIILAFFLLREAFDRNIGGFGDFMRKVFDKVKLSFDAIVQLFTQGGFSGAVRKELNKAGNEGVKNFAITVFLWFNRIKAFFGGIAESFEGIGDSFAPTFEILIDSFKELASIFGIAFSGPNDPKAAAAAFDAFAFAGRVVGGMLRGLVEGIAFIIEQMAIFITMPIAGVAALRDLGKAFLEEMGGAIPDTMDEVIEQIEGGFSVAWLGLKNVVAEVVRGILTSLQFMVGGTARAIDQIGSFFGKDLGAAKAIGRLAGDLQSQVETKLGVTTTVTPAGRALATPAAAAIAAAPSVSVAERAGEVLAENRRSFTAQFSDPQLRRLAEEIAQQQRPVIIELDGDIIADSSRNANRRAAARSFGPEPAGI